MTLNTSFRIGIQERLSENTSNELLLQHPPVEGLFESKNLMRSLVCPMKSRNGGAFRDVVESRLGGLIVL